MAKIIVEIIGQDDIPYGLVCCELEKRDEMVRIIHKVRDDLVDRFYQTNQRWNGDMLIDALCEEYGFSRFVPDFTYQIDRRI